MKRSREPGAGKQWELRIKPVLGSTCLANKSSSEQRTCPFSTLMVPVNVQFSSCERTRSTTLLLHLGSQGVSELRMGACICKKDRRLAALPENPFLQSHSEPWVRLKDQVLLPLTHSWSNKPRCELASGSSSCPTKTLWLHHHLYLFPVLSSHI